MHFETPHNEIKCVLSVQESNFKKNGSKSGRMIAGLFLYNIRKCSSGNKRLGARCSGHVCWGEKKGVKISYYSLLSVFIFPLLLVESGNIGRKYLD